MPHNHDAERRLLGAMILEGQVENEKSLIGQAMSEGLEPLSFHKPEHHTIFEAMVKLSSSRHPIDEVTVAEQVGQATIKDGTLKFLSELTERVDTLKGFETHLRIVLDKYNARRMIIAAQDVIEVMSVPTVTAETGLPLITKPMEVLSTALMPQKGEPLGAVVDRVWENLKADRVGKSFAVKFNTGLANFDRLCGPFRKGTDFYNCIAARPSRGKTTLYTQWMQYMLRTNEDLVALDFQLENSRDNHIAQMIGRAGQINLREIANATDEQMAKAEEQRNFLDSIKEDRLFIYDNLRYIEDICARARYVAKKCVKRGGVGIMGFDFIQRIHARGVSDRASPHERIGYVSSEIKSLAKELNCCAFVLAQVSRDSDKSDSDGNKRKPHLWDLKECGRLEEDADRVIFIHPDGTYDDKKGGIIVDLIQRKNRYGPSEVEAKAVFVKETTTFWNYGIIQLLACQ